MPESNLPPDEPQVEPTVRELLVAEVDATCRRITLELDRLNRIADQLAPDWSRSCQVAIALTRVGVDEIQLRAAARPLDEPESGAPHSGSGPSASSTSLVLQPSNACSASTTGSGSASGC